MTEYKVVPVEPSDEQWGGLARDLMMWLDMGRPSVENLKLHLENLGVEPPAWLTAEAEFGGTGVPSKGSRVAWIYKAMLAASPDTGMVAVPRDLLARIVKHLVEEHEEVTAILEASQ